MNKTKLNSALLSLAINVAFCIYYITVGFKTHSWWLLTLGTYYGVLSIMRHIVINSKESNRFSVKKITGILLIIMTVPLVGTVILAAVEDRGTDFHEIVMITIAVYAFTKITLASVNLAKSRHSSTVKTKTLRSISFADAFVCIFSLQRSMLVSFGDMPDNTIKTMNIATGSAVSVIVFIVGIKLFTKK